MPAESVTAIWKIVYDALFPGEAERDPAFRQDIVRLSRIALLVIGGVQIGVSLFLTLARVILMSEEWAALTFRFVQGAVLILIGMVSLLCAHWKRIENWWRFLGAVSGLVTAAVLIWSSMLASLQMANPDDFIPGQITLIMLVGVTVVPLRPAQIFWMGSGIGAIYVAATTAAQRYLRIGSGPEGNVLLFIFMLSLLCTGITAVVYQQRLANFELRREQVRAMMAENAASMARLAAALSHELNNPMGALLSGIDTLLLVASKQAATTTPSEQQRLVILQADLRKSVQQSAQRLKGLVSRIQRFTNLDQAEVQNANLNELLTDVAALVEPQLPSTAKLELDLKPVQTIVCRPQQISAVFSNLVTNAVRALDGAGGEVRIATRQVNSNVEVEVRDNGRGVDQSKLEGIFDPGFTDTGSRVRAGNWSMFSSRQIIREHGGDIRIQSDKGKGTTVRVTLPAAKAAVT